jgi:hypothetical protein
MDIGEEFAGMLNKAKKCSGKYCKGKKNFFKKA